MADNARPDATKGHISIFGAGSWGLTLAWLFGDSGNDVILYTRSAEKAKHLAAERSISDPVKVDLPASVKITSDLKEACAAERLLILACTSQTVRELSKAINEVLPVSGKATVVVSAVKGLELETLKRMSEVIAESMPGTNVCALSGPNLAEEILLGMPAATVVSCKEADVAASVQSVLTSKKFRVYTNTDIVGVELGGSLKNIIAIAAGALDGLKLGANSKAALLTRGLAEMTRLSVTLGGESSTLAGLAGMGDLFATSSAVSSRNYRLGQALAKGSTAKEAQAALGAVAEGVSTTFAVCELAKRLNLDLPIASAVESMLLGKTTPEGAIMTLMSRPPVAEARLQKEKPEPFGGKSVNSIIGG